MFHKNAISSVWSEPKSTKGFISNNSPVTDSPTISTNPRLTLVPTGGSGTVQNGPSPLGDILSIAAPKCSAFLAEAAVLVLVFALLDRFMLKGRTEIGWVVSAFGISVLLLVASIVTDFSARRWLQPR